MKGTFHLPVRPCGSPGCLGHVCSRDWSGPGVPLRRCGLGARQTAYMGGYCSHVSMASREWLAPRRWSGFLHVVPVLSGHGRCRFIRRDIVASLLFPFAPRPSLFTGLFFLSTAPIRLRILTYMHLILRQPLPGPCPSHSHTPAPPLTLRMTSDAPHPALWWPSSQYGPPIGQGRSEVQENATFISPADLLLAPAPLCLTLSPTPIHSLPVSPHAQPRGPQVPRVPGGCPSCPVALLPHPRCRCASLQA